MGQWSYEVPLLEKEDIPSYLKHVGAELVEGRMPEGDGEVLVDKTMMKNQGLSVGSWFMQNWYGENFKVCGVIESEGMACVGTPMGYTNGGWYILILNDEKTCDAEKLLSEIGIKISDQDEIIDAVNSAEQYDSEIKGPIETVINAIFAIVIIFLAISVMVAYLSFMRNRVNEYCLYASIGYSRNDIYGMIIREMLLIFGIGIFIGFLTAIVIAVVINKTLIDPKGLVGHVLYGNRLYGIVSTYIFIMGVLQLPVLLNINDIKTIDAIED
jgi:ABC-type antimicrobial peptide transport system permease subunit